MVVALVNGSREYGELSIDCSIETLAEALDKSGCI